MNRGEVWLVELNPTRGQEIQKTRPAVIISQNSISTLSVRVVVPLTAWKSHFAPWIWIVPIAPTAQNGLSKLSGANALQVRCVSTERLIKRVGVLTAQQVTDIVAAVGLVIDHP